VGAAGGETAAQWSASNGVFSIGARFRPISHSTSTGSSSCQTHAGIIAPTIAFGHWLLCRLPRLHSLTRAGAASNLLSNAQPWNDQPLFDAFGIAPTSVVRLRCEPIQLTRVDRVVLATHASPPLSERRIDSARLARLFDDLSVQWGAELSRAETPADVYITRRTGQGEREGCQNPDELERFFADQGYAVIYPPDLTPAEQFALALRARSVVGETGSGVIWAMACASGASVTYITPRSGNFDQEYDPNRKGWARVIADARGLHFGQIIASTSTSRKRWSADIDS